jgi:hypothetical protein
VKESKASRREAAKEFKERKIARGAFAVKCGITAQVWVGSTMNLDASRNSTWFSLRHGSHHDKALQAAWNEHGDQNFSYEILEKLDDDVSPLEIWDLLKKVKRRWVEQLGASALL